MSGEKVFLRTSDEAIGVIEQRQACVGLIGLGRIGLPLAVILAKAGFRVTGVDINEEVVRQVNDNVCPYPDEIGLAEAMISCENRLTASTDLKSTQDCDVLIIALPTVLDANSSPDLRILMGVATNLGALLVPGQILVLQSTVPLGTTSRIMELLEARGMVGGRDFGLVYSPERVQSPQVLRDLISYPKVVAGFDPHSTRIVSELYRSFAPKIIEMSSPMAAELEKLVENSFRDLVIGFANQISQLCQLYQLDVAEVIRAANSQPYCHIPNPGLVGGHCIPYVPHFLLWSAREKAYDASITRTARELNESMFEDVFSWVEGEKVTVYGLSFKPDVQSFEFSHTWKLLRMLEASSTTVHDPFLNGDRYPGLLVKEDQYEAAVSADCVIFATAHTHYQNIDLRRLRKSMRGNLMIDVRAIFDPTEVKAAGFRYRGLGRYGQD